MNLQVAHFLKHETVPSMSLQLALQLLLLMILQLYYLPPPLILSDSNTLVHPMLASVAILYYKIKSFLCITCVKHIINRLQYSST